MTGWTVSNGGVISWDSDLFKTYNGGNNWTQIHSSNGHYFDIIFLNDFKGYKVGDSFCRSYDGGTTWDCIEIDMDYGYAMEVIDENRIWIAGTKDFPTTGNIRLSNDEGTTWMEIVGDSIPVMNDIKFIGPNLGWAVGNTGTILHTANGGETWEYQESGTTADLFSISFVDENHGWICGDSSIILSTSNGGITGLDTQVQTSNFKVRSYPNPVSENCMIEFEMATPTRVSIQIYNNIGKLLFEPKNQIYSAGRQHQVCLNLIDLKEGIYFCRVQIGNEMITKKIIKL